MDKKGVDNLKKIIQGKEPEKKIQVGYKSNKVDRPTGEGHEIGEEWKENGKRWKKKEDGTVERVSTMEKYRMPWFCPECGKIMKGNKDKKVWYQRGTCLNCLVDYHLKLQRAGKFEQFAWRKRLLSSKDYYKEQLSNFDDFKSLVETNPEYVHASGELDKWTNNLDSETIVEEYKNYLKDYKEKLDTGIKNYEEKYGESLDEWTEPE